jgi:hypothetical protein
VNLFSYFIQYYLRLATIVADRKFQQRPNGRTERKSLGCYYSSPSEGPFRLQTGDSQVHDTQKMRSDN